jgi:hypothetical protein
VVPGNPNSLYASWVQVLIYFSFKNREIIIRWLRGLVCLAMEAKYLPLPE